MLKKVRYFLRAILLRSPIDIGKLISAKVKIHNYVIHLRSSALSIAYWHNPEIRSSSYEFLMAYLEKDDIYIDIGANIGTTIIPVAKAYESGTFICFEPHPKTFAYLMENICLNNLEKVVSAHNIALGNETGEVKFSSFNSDDQNKISGKGISVPVKRLDHFTQALDLINLVKLDVEGYEKLVVEGGLETLKKTECVYFELSEENFKQFGYTVSDLLSIFLKMEFNLFLKRNLNTLEPLDTNVNPKKLTNAFAIKNLDEFIRRTNWTIIPSKFIV